ncbi:DNA modification methylase [Oceanobacillus caeni]
MNEIQLSNDINVITAEINSYKQVAGQSIFEIGKRLKHVKYHPSEYGLPEGKDKNGSTIVARGAWGSWLENINIEDHQARRYMTVAGELTNRGMSHDKGLDALYLIATIPEQEREQQHKIPSTGETKTVDEMTVRELREVKKCQLRKNPKRLTANGLLGKSSMNMEMNLNSMIT